MEISQNASSDEISETENQNNKAEHNNITKVEEEEKEYREEVKSSFGIKRYKIQEVIKPGQVILIQVIKGGKRTKRCCFNNFYFFGWKIFSLNA